MRARRSVTHLSLIALVITLTPVVGIPPAVADSSLQCTASATIYTTRNNLFLTYQHLEPETGANAWGPQQHIGTWGLTARHMAGPNGIIYNAVNTGELRRLRWNGTSWDTFAGGLTHEIIDTNPIWANFSTPEHFNKITVDTHGDLYTLEADNYLHWRRYNPTTRTWIHRKLEYWSGISVIVAAGKGVIYAYGSGTGLRRFEYDPESQRSQIWNTTGIGQSAYSRIFSPGADILFGVRPDTGALVWFRYNPDTMTWVNGVVNGQAVGTVINTGWGNDYETFAAPDTCLLLGRNPWPTRPQITPRPQAPVTLANSYGTLQYSYVDFEGRAVYAETTDITGGTPIRLAAVPGMTGVTGTTYTASDIDDRVLIFANGLDGEGHANTQIAALGTWGDADAFGGYFTQPTMMPSREGESSPYAFAFDHDGSMWMRQLPGGLRLTTWQKTTFISETNEFPVAVAPRGVRNHVWILSYNPTTTRFSRRVYDPTTNTPRTRQDLGGPGFLNHPPAVTSAYTDCGPPPCATLPGYGFVATGTDRVVYGLYISNVSDWIAIPGVQANGPPSASLAADDKIKVVVRGTDGLIYYTSQTAPDATTFDPWQAIPDTDESATDPTVVAFANTWVVAYRTDLDIPILRRYVPSTTAAPNNTPDLFVDVPLTPPA